MVRVDALIERAGVGDFVFEGSSGCNYVLGENACNALLSEFLAVSRVQVGRPPNLYISSSMFRLSGRPAVFGCGASYVLATDKRSVGSYCLTY